jgi:KUP system potassium uptake protein
MIGAIGVIYGDIGTSPLYAIKESFSGAHPLPVDSGHILGVLSLVFWSIIIVISGKYTMLLMRADNKGQGGSLALLALVSQATQKTWLAPVVVLLGISAGALFYGDSMITPAISVLSAVEGLEIALPGLNSYVIPITLVILVALFLFQSRGSSFVGRLFGPVMITWFLTLAVLGIYNIAKAPEILAALNPWYAVQFFLLYKMTAFLALGSVVLVLTGGEALYTDMSHFGRRATRLSWFCLVLPALALNYFGQGALLLTTPDAVANPFFRMVPSWAVLPMVGLATMATVMASQAVITGAFSITRQAMQLGFLPRMATVHTSAAEAGQIYIPFVNWLLMLSVIALVLGFQSSTNLAGAYGIAVTGTMLVASIQLTIVMFLIWKWNPWVAGTIGAALTIIDLAFFSANMTKLTHGGWFPLAVGVGITIFLTTWKKGRELLFARRADDAMPVDTFLTSLNPSVTRVPGTSVFLSGTTEGVPHALLHNLKHNRVVHERVVFLTVITEEVPHVPENERLTITHLGRRFYRLILRYGFMDETDIPLALKAASQQNFEFNDMETSFFLGRETVMPSRRPGMAIWREHLFAWMLRSATSAMNFFKLPPNRVVEMGTQVEI